MIGNFHFFSAEDLRSPVRKEVKIGHERLLRRELEQWKELMKENELRQSVTQRYLFCKLNDGVHFFSKFLSQSNHHRIKIMKILFGNDLKIINKNKIVSFSNNVHVHTNVDDIDCILKADQMSFIAKIVDIPKLIEESHEFRYNFDFFLRLNKLLMNTKTDKSDEALDKAKQQAIGFNTSDRMHCEPFQPIET